MFFVRNDFGYMVELKGDNVISYCAECNEEVKVDLVKLLKNADADLTNSYVFCKNCSKKYL